jgi:hypothetical protein
MRSSKPGPDSVAPSSRGRGNTVNNSGGMGGYSCPQKPIPGPVSSGPPASMRKALGKKSTSDKGSSFPGSVR